MGYNSATEKHDHTISFTCGIQKTIQVSTTRLLNTENKQVVATREGRMVGKGKIKVIKRYKLSVKNKSKK